MMKIRHVVLGLMVLINIVLLGVAWRVATNRQSGAARLPVAAGGNPAAAMQPAQPPAVTASEGTTASVNTALAAYALAEPLAASWAGDAQLLRARGDWPQGSFAPQLENWVFVFYSPGQQETVQINVVEGEARLAATGAADNAMTPTTAEQWQVDSDRIVSHFLNGAGGELFIDERQDVTLVLTLSMGDAAIWTATLVDWETGDVFGREFDAHSGFLAPEL